MINYSQFAFDEFRKLVNRLNVTQPGLWPADTLTLRYACSLVAELAYYKVPEFEIDDWKRAKLVPCEAYREIVEAGVPTSVIQYLANAEYPNPFEIVDRGVVAVGFSIDRVVFIGFRGTSYLYDWKINANAWMSSDGYGGRVHRGYAEEAARISRVLSMTMASRGLRKPRHLVLTGHSLGGAVAGLADILWASQRGATEITTCIFGSPRYGDVISYARRSPVASIRRRGDIVPLLPPRAWGYADQPQQFSTAGGGITGRIDSSPLPYVVWEAMLFAGKLCRPHDMEKYRQELGACTDATLFRSLLAPVEKLR